MGVHYNPVPLLQQNISPGAKLIAKVNVGGGVGLFCSSARKVEGKVGLEGDSSTCKLQIMKGWTTPPPLLSSAANTCLTFWADSGSRGEHSSTFHCCPVLAEIHFCRISTLAPFSERSRCAPVRRRTGGGEEGNLRMRCVLSHGGSH